MKPNENVGSGAYERSTVYADHVKTLRALKRYLCSLAVAPDGTVNVEQCRKCFSQCAYGKKYVKMSDEETEVTIEMTKNVAVLNKMTPEEIIEKLRKELAEEERQRKAAESAREEAQKEKDRLENDCAWLVQKVEAKTIQMEKMRRETEKMEKDCARLEAELAKAKKEGRTAEERLLEMDVEADRLRGEIRQLEAVNNTLADVEAGLEAEILKMRKQLEEEKAERAGMEMRMMRMKVMVFDLEHGEGMSA